MVSFITAVLLVLNQTLGPLINFASHPNKIPIDSESCIDNIRDFLVVGLHTLKIIFILAPSTPEDVPGDF